MAIKLEVGKTYLDGFGERVLIDTTNPHNQTHPFENTAGGIYTAEGVRFVDGDPRFNLIREFVEGVDDRTVAPESGKHYETLSGRHVHITGERPFHVGHKFGSSLQDTYYNEKGEANTCEGDNLLKEVPEPYLIDLKFGYYEQWQMGKGLVYFEQSTKEQEAGQYDPHVLFEHRDSDNDDPAVKAQVAEDGRELRRLLNKYRVNGGYLTDEAKACDIQFRQ